MMRKLLFVLLFALCAFAQNPNTARWPSNNAADSDLFVATNNAHTTLNGSIDAVVTTIVLTSGAKFPAPVILTIEGELVHCQSLSTNTASSCTRGSQGTSAASHASGVAVYGYMTAWHLNQHSAEIKAIEASALRVNNANTLGSSATLDASAAAHTLPDKTGLNAAKPATCTASETYWSTDTMPHRWRCGAGNAWGQDMSRVCEVHIWGTGTSQVLQDTDDEVASCRNAFGIAETITAVSCWANAGSPTVQPVLTSGSLTSILSSALTCGTGAWAAGTLNGSPSLASGNTIDANIVTSGGTASNIRLVFTLTR